MNQRFLIIDRVMLIIFFIYMRCVYSGGADHPPVAIKVLVPVYESALTPLGMLIPQNTFPVLGVEVDNCFGISMLTFVAEPLRY